MCDCHVLCSFGSGVYGAVFREFENSCYLVVATGIVNNNERECDYFEEFFILVAYVATANAPL